MSNLKATFRDQYGLDANDSFGGDYDNQYIEWLENRFNECNTKTKMIESELEGYQKLTKLQKEFVDALVILGFTHKYFSTWELLGWGDINVSRVRTLSELLKLVHAQGKNQTRYEFQRILGI